MDGSAPHNLHAEPGRSLPQDCLHRFEACHEALATTSTLAHYILGATTQSRRNTGDDGVPGSETDRAEFLDTASRAWLDLDPDEYPFVRAVADQMREHDDREQFLTGINLVLTGITTLYPPTP